MDIRKIKVEDKWFLAIPIGDKTMTIGPYPTEKGADEGKDLIETYRKAIDNGTET